MDPLTASLHDCSHCFIPHLLNNTGNVPLNYIMKQAQFNKEIYKFNKEYLRCVCILCSDKNFKNILNLYFSVNKPAAPFKLFRSFSKVNKYLDEKFNIKFNLRVFDINGATNITEEEEDDANELSPEQSSDQTHEHLTEQPSEQDTIEEYSNQHK